MGEIRPPLFAYGSFITGGNLSLQTTLTDMCEPGSCDTIAFTLWNSNRLVFSSQWNGTQTL